MATRKAMTPKPSPAESIARDAMLDEVIRKFSGPLDELESAIGMYMIGRHFGWKILHMIHTKSTIRKYEEILGVKIAEVFDPFGPDAERSNAYTVLQKVSSFWKVVSGDEKVPLDRQTRRSIS